MANQWYVQHGGKLYGPMTSTNLKKLADEKKISPTTQVRLGTEGTFGPASRVQGLFVAPPPPPSILDLDELAPPPLAKPLPRAAVARAAVPKAAPVPAPSLCAKNPGGRGADLRHPGTGDLLAADPGRADGMDRDHRRRAGTAVGNRRVGAGGDAQGLGPGAGDCRVEQLAGWAGADFGAGDSIQPVRRRPNPSSWRCRSRRRR